MLLEWIFKTFTAVFTVISAYLFVSTLSIGTEYLMIELNSYFKIGAFFFFIGISMWNVPYIKPTVYALAYSYVVYWILHLQFAVDLAIQRLGMEEDKYLKSPVIGMISVMLSSLTTGLVPLIWKIGTSYLEHGSLAKHAGLFLATTQANHIPISRGFHEYIGGLRTINKLKFKCVTGYHTFASNESIFHEIFTTKIDHSIDKIEILLTNPEGTGFERRARILANNLGKTRNTVLNELKEETKDTLTFLNSLPYKENIQLRFCDDDEARYKILLLDQVVLVQGYFGSQDINNESIYGFKEVEKTTSMYKLFQKLFNEKFENTITKKINHLPAEYHLFNPNS